MGFIQTSPMTKIHYQLINKSSSSSTDTPLLLFLHYWGGSSSTWYKLTSPDSPTSLSRRYPCVSIDQRGWGQSVGPDTAASDYSVTPLATDLVAVLEALVNTEDVAAAARTNGIILVGHSMGGKVALAALANLPLEILALIKGLVLVAPAPPTPLILPPDMAEQQKHAYDSHQSAEFVVSNVLSNADLLSKDDISMVVRDNLLGNQFAKEGWIMHGMQQDLLPLLPQISSRPHARDIKVRVLGGEFDVVEPQERVQKEVVQRLTGHGFSVDYTLVSGARHLIPLENPEAVQQAIDGIVKN